MAKLGMHQSNLRGRIHKSDTLMQFIGKSACIRVNASTSASPSLLSYFYAWVVCPVKVRLSGNWTAKALKVWNGASWVTKTLKVFK